MALVAEGKGSVKDVYKLSERIPNAVDIGWIECPSCGAKYFPVGDRKCPHCDESSLRMKAIKNVGDKS